MNSKIHKKKTILMTKENKKSIKMSNWNISVHDSFNVNLILQKRDILINLSLLNALLHVMISFLSLCAQFFMANYVYNWSLTYYYCCVCVLWISVWKLCFTRAREKLQDLTNFYFNSFQLHWAVSCELSWVEVKKKIRSWIKYKFKLADWVEAIVFLCLCVDG